MFICLSTRICQKHDGQTSRNLLYVLPVAPAWFFSDDSTICYVLLVLWMTSFLPIMGHMAHD